MLNFQLDETAIRDYITNIVKTEVSKIAVQQKEWLTLQEVCEEFKLPMNNVKDRKWRTKNKFPYYQPAGPYGQITYNRSEVAKWLRGQ